MPNDLNTWLEDATKNANLSPEDRKALEGVLARPALSQFARESFLRQSDYDRRMNEMKSEFQKRQEEVAAKEQQLTELQTSVGGWYEENRGKHAQALQELEAARTREYQLAQRMKTVAATYGVPDDEINVPGIEASLTPPTKAAETNVPAKDYVTRDDFSQSQQIGPRVAAALNDLNAEHAELFGKPLRNASALVEKAMKERKPLREVWETENKVSERRAELEAKSRKEEIDRAVQEREMQLRSEYSIPAQRPETAAPRILRERLPAPAEIDKSRGVRAAIEKYNSGAYRPTA